MNRISLSLNNKSLGLFIPGKIVPVARCVLMPDFYYTGTGTHPGTGTIYFKFINVYEIGLDKKGRFQVN